VRWRVWCRWAPWRGYRTAWPLRRCLDLMDFDIGPVPVICLLLAVPAALLVLAEVAAKVLLTPVAMVLRSVLHQRWPVEIQVGRFGRWNRSQVLAVDRTSAFVVCTSLARQLRAGVPLNDPRLQRSLSEADALFVPVAR
jgi:hypothetical protein